MTAPDRMSATVFRPALLAALAAVCCCPPALAEEVRGFDDLRFWTGEGANESAIVIDWGDGDPRDPLAWGYRWDGAATAEDAVLAVVAADRRLAATFDDFGSDGDPNLFVNSFGYDRDGDGFAADDADDSFAASGDFVSDFRFWEFLTAATSPYVGGAWASSDFGISSTPLVEGLWNGFRFDADFPGPGPGPPVAAPAAVPEPSTWLLIAAAGALGGGRRVRRRRPAR